MDVVNPSRDDEDQQSRQVSQSGQGELPFPLARITTCGGLKLDVLQRAPLFSPSTCVMCPSTARKRRSARA
jgi:hypothetical protein